MLKWFHIGWRKCLKADSVVLSSSPQVFLKHPRIQTRVKCLSSLQRALVPFTGVRREGDVLDIREHLRLFYCSTSLVIEHVDSPYLLFTLALIS